MKGSTGHWSLYLAPTNNKVFLQPFHGIEVNEANDKESLNLHKKEKRITLFEGIRC